MNFLDGMTRWCVPVFVMISGAAVLGRNYPIGKIKKAILRFCMVYIFWSVVYAGVAFASGKRLKEVFSVLVLGDTHMWFIPMIAGLYILIPLLDNLIKDMRLTKYYLCLAFLIAIVVPTCATVVNYLNPYLGKIAKTFIGNMGICFVTGYTGYFVLGKYLSVQNKFANNKAILCYAFGIIGCVMTFLVPQLISSGTDTQIWAYGNMTINVFASAVAVFVFVKRTLICFPTNRLVEELAFNSFGVYLIHFLFVKLIAKEVGLENAGAWSFAVVLIISVIIFVSSNILVSLARRCPGISKVI